MQGFKRLLENQKESISKFRQHSKFTDKVKASSEKAWLLFMSFHLV